MAARVKDKSFTPFDCKCAKSRRWELKMEMNILFPVLNEKRRLKRGIEATVAYMKDNVEIPWHLTILDNGSTDETGEIAKKLSRKYKEVSYVRVEERGVGVAFRKGVELNQCAIVGYMDIDLSTDVSHLADVIHIFQTIPEVDYINGSRFSRNSDTLGRKWYRKITSMGLVILLKSVLKMKADDAVCGFTFMRKGAAEKLVEASSKENGWFYMIELLLRAERMHMRIMEMPVKWVDDYDTKVKLWKTIANYTKEIYRLARTFRKEEKENAAKN